jgi:uncharacterized protein (TIGR02001 family)
MKKSLLAIAATLAAAAVPTVASAQVAFNVGATTDYRYRGVSQTQLKPALQGGVDYANGGFYVGAWASTIRWIKKAGGDSNVEVDLYGGYKGEITKGLGYDVGILAYIYPSNDLGTDADTQEIYGALTYGPVTFKYSHAVSNLFGVADSKNSYYADLSASFEVMDGWSLTPHVGYQKVKGPNGISYADYSVAMSKDFNGLVPSIAIVGTDLSKSEATVDGKFLGKTGLVLSVKYNF